MRLCDHYAMISQPVTYYLAIQRSVWRDIEFAFVFLPAIRSLERKARYLFYFCCFVRFFTRHSLVERRARYLFYCVFVCLFVRLTISQQPAGRFTPYFACGRSLSRDVSSPLLGVGGPRRVEKEANEIFVTMGVNGEFLHFGGF